MNKKINKKMNRRDFIRNNAVAASGLLLSPFVGAVDKNGNDRILVVVELSGGNDGLNSVVPFRDDAYYQSRPTIAIKKNDLLLIDDNYGLNPGMLGFERLWKKGELAIVHGCGYENPSYSHFTSMAYWHTAAPNSGEKYGWMGRLADSMSREPSPNSIINIGTSQSLAVNSQFHTPVVFDDPERFQRNGFFAEKNILEAGVDIQNKPFVNPTRKFLNDVAKSARHSSQLVRQAWTDYQTPIDYGIAALDLPKVAACIARGLPTQLYHVSFRNNAFDTHVQQPALHRRLLSYACDGIHGFVRDIERLGLSDRVVVLVYSEFGRRVAENANQGTDHGSANTMFLVGKNVNGGHYGAPPSLTNLCDGGNLKHTTDFRQVYATAISEWMQHTDTDQVLKGDFPSLPIFT
jgi:uncharacterized protein (DUF1501 family)